MLRTCKKCSQERELELFRRAPKCVDGRAYECKACQADSQRERQLRLNPIDERPREIARKLFEQGFRKCLGCEEVRPLTEYWKNSRWPNGYNTYCKACRKSQTGSRKAYYRAYDDRPEVAEKKRLQSQRRHGKSPRIVMQITLRHGLKRRPTENPATIDDLMAKWTAQDGKCAVTGIAMTWAQGKVLPTSISLDRIDPEGGYSADNLRLVCHAVNAFKGRMTDAEMIDMARAIVNKADAATTINAIEWINDVSIAPLSLCA